jgi:imidazolonepropionase
LAQLLLLRGAKQLLTLRGPNGVRRGASLSDLGIIEDGSVLIQDGRIISVGPTRRIENLKETKDAVEIPVNGAVVMPGFADPAIHVSLWERPSLPGAVARRKKSLNFYHESLTLVRSCLQHGTLNAEFKVCSDPISYAADVAALRQLLAIGSNPVAMVRTLRLQSSGVDEANLVGFAAQLRKLRRGKLAHFIELAVDHAAPPLNTVLKLLSEAGLPLNLTWAGGSIELLRRLLQLAQPQAVFCSSELQPAESALLARSSSIVVFSPCKDLLEERENPSAKKFAAADGAIALGSGYHSKDAPIFSMQMVVALAVLRLRLSVEQAISAATINAAHAMGRGAEVGSIEVGKRADLLVLNLSDYREMPRRIGVNQVAMALRDGNFVINRKRAKASAP